MSKVIICLNCGHLAWCFDNEVNDRCHICSGKLEVVNSLNIKTLIDMSYYEKEQFATNYVGHDFDPELKAKRIDYVCNRNAQISKTIEKSNANHPECTYCHSRNTKKITTGSKIAHTALFGVFSMGRNSKNYHCNECGSDF